MWKNIFTARQNNNNNNDAAPQEELPGTVADSTNPNEQQQTQQRLLQLRSSETIQLERQVSMAARELVEGVQSIVLEAKQKQLDWKERLLQLLGEQSNANDTTPIMLLLKHCNTLPTFASRCIEQELPPNLVHCLRLLRVLELKNTDTEKPAAAKATRNTSRLLIALCTSAQTGEQLQSHLFGLLALSGASYPETGLAVALAASSVITVLAQHCWTPQIVWYIHDRKMIYHMTDDVKDLMQLSTPSSGTSVNTGTSDGGSVTSNGSLVPNGLVGPAAEQAGLWSMALKTLITLVYYSTQYGSTSLVEDFTAAGGFAVLKAALEQSTAPHGRELVELVPLLVCCGYRMEPTNLDEYDSPPRTETFDLKLAQHPIALEMFQTLLQQSNPLFDENETVQSFVFPEAFVELTARSLQRASSGDPGAYVTKYAFDLQGEFLSIVLRLFADHPDNYELLEESYHALTYGILALPCLPTDSKNFVLKTLEFVLTGVGVKQQLAPIHACVEIFMALIHSMIVEKNNAWLDDATLMASTFEKWLQFDQRVAPLLFQSGMMTAKLEALLGWLESQEQQSDTVGSALDIICRVYRLLVAHIPPQEQITHHPLHTVLQLTVSRNWGIDACHAVAGVMETFLIQHPQDLPSVLEPLTTNQVEQEKSILLWNMVRNVLEVTGRDLFRECGGFEKLLECTAVPMNVILSVVDAALGLRSKNTSNQSSNKDGLYWQPAWVDPNSSQLTSWSATTRNRCYLHHSDFYAQLAKVFGGSDDEKILQWSLAHVGCDKDTIKNTDAIRLVVALVNNLPPSNAAAQAVVQQLVEWTESPSLLQQLASAGLIHALSDEERWQTLRLKLASYRLSLTDFVNLLRSHAGPLLLQQDRIKLPIVSGNSKKSNVNEVDEEYVVSCLHTLVQAARASSRATSFVTLGGDSINSIAVLKHDVPLADRLRSVAEEGRLHYMEMDALCGAEEGVESSLNSSGFSYSLWFRHTLDAHKTQGNLYVLDLASSLHSDSTASATSPSTQPVSYLTVWYDVPNQRFNVCTSARGESICFPVTPLIPNVWHHLMLTYSPAKRSMMSRKSTVSLYIDGRSLEAEVRVDAVTFPSKSKITIGAPNPTLAVSGIVRGRMPFWEVGNLLLISTVLLDYDATAIYCHGPHFPGLLWGDRPQRTSLAATATSSFIQFSLNQEPGSLASALRRRDIVKMERAGYSKHSDELQSLHLYCQIPPEVLLAAYQPGTAQRNNHRVMQQRLYNLAALAGSESVASDAILFGLSPTMVRHPTWFADALWQAGGPELFMPLIHAAPSSYILAQCLALLRYAVRGHIPNLSRLQSSGGYRVLGVLLQEKNAVDVNCMDQCLAFAIFDYFQEGNWNTWILQDLDAMKHLLLNHKVWDLRKYGPEVPLRLLRALNLLVDHRSLHKASNARRLHQVGIVRWTIHLMIEAAELYMNDKEKAWVCDSPLVTEITVGGDPGNMFLLECKNLLRRVLTFMLTPGDLGALAEASIYTVSIAKNNTPKDKTANDIHMQPSSIMRLHLVRLMEELIVDGVNEIVASHTMNTGKTDRRDAVFQPHSGGVASPGQPYFSTPNRRGLQADGVTLHPKHQQAQAFLAAFSGFLTPVWFATLLEGGREEASVAATFRLMILLLQGSSSFETNFEQSGGFTPFVLSVPRYSTSPGLAIAMLSQLLNVPILHLHSLPHLDPDQLCELFDAEGDDHTEIPVTEDPSSGIFALLAECLGRNIKISHEGPSDLADRATDTNQAIFQLLLHRFEVSTPFREFCFKKPFCVPLSQTLCSILGSKLPIKVSTILSDAPQGPKPSERFVGNNQDKHAQGMGLVRLLRRILIASIKDDLLAAATTVRTLFRSFPIHATPDQAQAFHLIVLENCTFAIEKVMEEGDAIAVANCVGIGSVLLELVVQGFFSSQAVLQAFQTTVGVLDKLVKFETKSVHSLSNAEHSFMTHDASHIAQAMAAVALHQSAVSRPYLRHGDEELQCALLHELVERADAVLLVPSNDRRNTRRIPTQKFQVPKPGNKMYHLWQSTSVARVIGTQLYPDLASSERPDLAVLAPLLVVVYQLLVDGRDDIRGMAITILVRLLKHREKAMTELLVAQFQQADGSVERVDIVTRGGFRALLLAYEEGGTPQSLQRRYASFFDWLDRQADQVDVVFESVQRVSADLFPALSRYCTNSQSPVLAVESEQKRMLLKLTAEDSDRTIIGGLERSELSRHCNERTLERHNRWKRQGFDDLAYGAMALKVLLRRLKGPFGIWEGDQLPFEGVKHWKLDMTEGYERQRRRLMPNYEFNDLYNLDEANQESPSTEIVTEEEREEPLVEERVVAVEATAELLKDLKLKRAQHRDTEDEWDLEEFNVDAAEDATAVTSVTAASSIDGSALAEDEENEKPTESKEEVSDEESDKEDGPSNDDSYELVIGLLRKGDWPLKSYNVRRCTGLEVTQALLLFCQDAVYIIDGFEQINGEKISRVEREKSTYHVTLRPKDFKATEEEDGEKGGSTKAVNHAKTREKDAKKQHGDLTADVLHQHRSQRIEFAQLYSVLRRRYQLQQSGLEFFDIHKNATLVAFESNFDREEVLNKVLSSQLHPNSIFSVFGSSNYVKTISNYKQRIITQWMRGHMTNFDFLMHLNSLAGRSFNDLTQYPVFPWIIADYESEEIDLHDPKTYRDLSKNMGSLGEERAQQFRERYEALESTYFGEDDPPPFHYGTHFSSAAYTLYYLMRLEPFSRLALALQGGRFDVADRLFHDIGRSWKSASSENLQDVRELIPEFFYLPDFLTNTNGFDFGVTQRGKTVHDVTLPKWAKGDPERFVRINRQALESSYVSQHLHLWIDLVFGYKQRSVDDLNVFVHVTYEGEVDLESMTDPIQRASTIAQIQNFGQTPSRLERRPFPARQVVSVVRDNMIDFGVLPQLATMTPPLCVMGAPHLVKFTMTHSETVRLGLFGQTDRTVGDLFLVKGQVMGVGRLCTVMLAQKRYIRFGGLTNGISVYNCAASTRQREGGNLVSLHDGLHRMPISAAKASVRGDWLVTGCLDSTIRVWQFASDKLDYQAVLAGHDGYPITCLDLCTEFSVIVSGSEQGRVLVWDLRSLSFIRHLPTAEGHPVRSVSINNKNGNVVSLVGPQLMLSTINGKVLGERTEFSSPPTCAVATDCPEWMENGVVAVTGHACGKVCLWSLDIDAGDFVLRHSLEGSPHKHPITCVRVAGETRQDHVLVGDSSGKMSCWKVIQLEMVDMNELGAITEQIINDRPYI